MGDADSRTSSTRFSESTSFFQTRGWMYLVALLLVLTVPLLLLELGEYDSVPRLLIDNVVLVGAVLATIVGTGMMTLTVRVTDDAVHFRLFPFHFSGKEISTSAISRCVVEEAKSGYGRGIRQTSKGREYVVRGGTGVRIYRNDDPVFLSVEDADGLATAISDALEGSGRPQGSGDADDRTATSRRPRNS